MTHISTDVFFAHYGLKTDVLDSFVGHYEQVIPSNFEAGDQGAATIWSGKMYCRNLIRDVGIERMRVSSD